jgi:two-component system KDP operon response regulator KdpE
MENKLLALIVEDERAICHFISTVLKANGYRVVVAGKGSETPGLVSSHCPDIVLLDLGLPDIDGLEVLRSLREWNDVPVIVVSARGREREKVEALDLGADDYITKPFGTGELLARMRAAVRHAKGRDTEGAARNGVYTIGGLCVDAVKLRVTIDGKEVHVTPIEFRILELLAQNRGRVLTHDMIQRKVWGQYGIENQALRVNMANIRRKIETNPAEPRYILTEIGVGYRLVEE